MPSNPIVPITVPFPRYVEPALITTAALIAGKTRLITFFEGASSKQIALSGVVASGLSIALPYRYSDGYKGLAKIVVISTLFVLSLYVINRSGCCVPLSPKSIEVLTKCAVLSFLFLRWNFVSDDRSKLDAALSFNQEGVRLSLEDKHEDALTHYKQALLLDKAVLGEKSLIVATVLCNVGCILRKQFKHAESLPYFRQALEIRKELLSEKHPDIARTLHWMGCSLAGQFEYKEALKLHKEAFEMTKGQGVKAPEGNTELNNEWPLVNMSAIRKEVNESRPLIRSGRNSIANAIKNHREYKDALFYELRVLDLWKETDELEPLAVSSILHNIGYALDLEGKHEDALVQHKQALDIIKQALGERHFKVAESLRYVGYSLEKQGRYREALECYKQAVEIRSNVCGLLDVQFVLEALLVIASQTSRLLEGQLSCDKSSCSALQHNLGNFEEAKRLELEALAIKKKLMGENHPDVSLSLKHVGFALEELGKDEEALDYYLRSFRALCHPENAQGQEHKNVLSGILSLLEGMSNQTTKQQTKAELLQLCAEKFGENHELTLMVKNI